jgi:DNA mismatch endonuclease (patch repair protein)
MGDNVDSLSREERSALMSKVRSRGNRSTEVVVESALSANRIAGWKKHPMEVIGQPDFYFPSVRLAVFVDGCFWHACPRCGRIPKTRREFWEKKIIGNRKRDLRTRRQLRTAGFSTMRVWEHELKDAFWLSRLKARIAKLRRER